MSFARPLVLAGILLGRAVLAQTPVLSVEVAGPGAAARLLTVVAVDAPALDVLSRAAAVLGTPLKIDPAILDELGRARISVRRTNVVLDELCLLIGLKLSVAAGLEGGALHLRPGGQPEALAAAQALAHVDHVLLAHPSPELVAGLRYQRACLLLESGAADQAFTAFADLVSDFPGHPLSQGSRLLCVAAALRAGLHAEAVGHLAAIEESREGMPAIPGAALLAPRVHAAAGNFQEALLRARKIAASGRFERDRALAGLFAAEMHQRLGDGNGMIEALDRLPSSFERTCRDLVPKAALARGLALGLIHDERAALVHLRVALRSVDPASRARVARAISDCLAALDQPVQAWLAIRQAEALETDASEIVGIQARRAELEEAFGAVGRATETCTAVLKSASGPFAEAERVLATLTRCFLATDKVDEARVALEALADRETWRCWALYQLALLERRCRDPERALRALGRLDASSCKPPGPTADAVRTLRGELLLEIGDPLQAAEVFRGAAEEVSR
jgi:tetratricopeptide (TPR) repeat protein